MLVTWKLTFTCNRSTIAVSFESTIHLIGNFNFDFISTSLLRQIEVKCVLVTWKDHISLEWSRFQSSFQVNSPSTASQRYFSIESKSNVLSSIKGWYWSGIDHESESNSDRLQFHNNKESKARYNKKCRFFDWLNIQINYKSRACGCGCVPSTSISRRSFVGVNKNICKKVSLTNPARIDLDYRIDWRSNKEGDSTSADLIST